MYYVCEVGRAFGVIAGPFNIKAEATAAAGVIEIEKPQYQTRTEVWYYPDANNIEAGVVLPGIPTMPTAVH